METFQKRQIAYKVSIGTILRGKYVKQEGWEPNYLEFGEERISRVNVIGIIVGTDQTGNYETLLIEDGTGSISVRNFDKRDLFLPFQIGEAIMIIGKPREFNSEIYLIPEIIKKIENKKWIDLRLFELQRSSLENAAVEEPSVEEETQEIGIVEEKVEETKVKLNKMEQIYDLIKETDDGGGADYETIIEKIGDNASEIIEKLMKEGEIFEIAPGKLKVL